MPKAPPDTFSHVNPTGTPHNAHILRRNQACHQCRKRKLKCDAKRPCSTCVRSHSYAVAHAPAGSKIPPHPECTYDVVPDIPALEQRDPPKSRLEKLESRINELEALLSEKSRADGQADSRYSSPDGPGSSRTSSSMSILHLNRSSPATSIGVSLLESSRPESIVDPMPSLAIVPGHYSSALDSLADAAVLLNNPIIDPSGSLFNEDHQITSEEQLNRSAYVTPAPDPPVDVLPNDWPRNLPSPELLRHLADAFFSFYPDADRMFHRATFMSSLSLPPSHSRFPTPPLLHSICCVGSLYTGAVDPTPNPTSSQYPMDNLFDGRHRTSESRPYSFAEIQAEYARREIEGSIEMGQELFQSLQAEVLLSSWYWASAKWSEAFMSASRTLRCAIPLGLNVGSPLANVSDSLRPPSIIPPPKDVREDETRRNTFWITYALERTMGCGHGFALMLDDQDISQVLPLANEQYEQGVFVPFQDRQWSSDPNLLFVHPPDHTDPFVLFIKATILISRVKTFNSRFRAKYYAGDPATVKFNYDPNGELESVEPKDIRLGPAFMDVSRSISRFQNSIPVDLRHPVKDGVVNPHIFATCTAPLLAYILLHETHAHIESDACESALKILNGARGILNLAYDVYSTSYDLSLLGQFPMVAWFMAGRVLVRFLRAALDRKMTESSTGLRVEIDFLRAALTQAGERLPLAYRYNKMLTDYLCNQCGAQYANPLLITLPPRGMPPQAPANGPVRTSDLALNLMLEDDPISSKWNM